MFQVAAVVSATVSEVTLAAPVEALRTPSVAVVPAPDWATSELGFMVLEATGVTEVGIDTVMFAVSVDGSALLAVAVAVFVIVDPFGAVVAWSKVTCSTATRVEPAGIPTEPAGLGGEGSTLV